MADSTEKVAPRKGVELNLKADPNDPRRSVPAKANLSDLNAEDPEKEPVAQNPVE